MGGQRDLQQTTESAEAQRHLAGPGGGIPQTTGQQPSHSPLETTSLPGLKDSTSSSKPDGMISTSSEREQLPQNTDYANTLVTKMMFPEF